MSTTPASSSKGSLNRKKIIMGQRRRPRFQTDALHSHTRPVNHLPQLLPSDDVATRIKTQEQKDRVPYQDA